MKKHTAIYYEYFDYPIDPGFRPPSELSGKPATDIHHIEARGMGGSQDKDRIENLMALTREEHEEYGDKKQYKEMLESAHELFMINQLPLFMGWPDKRPNEQQKTRIL